VTGIAAAAAVVVVADNWYWVVLQYYNLQDLLTHEWHSRDLIAVD